jgi:hypothetical protein
MPGKTQGASTPRALNRARSAQHDSYLYSNTGAALYYGLAFRDKAIPDPAFRHDVAHIVFGFEFLTELAYEDPQIF